MKRAAVVLFLLTACVITNDWRQAEKDATAFAKKVPGSTGEVECAHKDTNDDGYCSCTIFMRDGTMRPLDCGCPSSAWVKSGNPTTGCKMQNKVMIQGVAQ